MATENAGDVSLQTQQEKDAITTNDPAYTIQKEATTSQDTKDAPLLNDNIETGKYTMYDALGRSIIISAGASLGAWIVYIIYEMIINGATTKFCKDPNYSCDVGISFFSNDNPPSCCNNQTLGGVDNQCYKKDDNIYFDDQPCEPLTKTVAPLIIQILLIFFLIFNIYMLYQASKKGIEIIKSPPSDNNGKGCKNKLKLCMQKVKQYKTKFDSKRYLVNCRKCALPKRKTPQENAVDFLWNSITILA